MKRLLALIALVLFIGAPLAEAAMTDNRPNQGRSVTTLPPGEILD